MGENKKVANSVVALSSAAVLAIYGAGYARTRAAADRFAQQAAERRPHVPAPRADRDAAPRETLSPAPTATAPAAAAVAATALPLVARDAAEPPAAAPPASSPRLPRVSTPETTPLAAAVSTPEATRAADSAVIGIPEDEGAPAAVAQAQAPLPAPAPAAPADTVKAGYKDGTYYGWGSCRHGDIQAAVVIEDGRITAAHVERCLTRYSCNWITPIPPRIVTKQGTTYDYVSGATESSDAFQDAVAEALSQAK